MNSRLGGFQGEAGVKRKLSWRRTRKSKKDARGFERGSLKLKKKKSWCGGGSGKLATRKGKKRA